MNEIKRQLLRVLRPGAVWKAFMTVLALAGLAATFTAGQHETPFGYLCYVFSAYVLAVLLAALPGVVKSGMAFLRRNKYSSRYLNDLSFRSFVSLHLSLLLNFVYALCKLAAGILYSSLWFGAAAVYYLVLLAVRLLLLRNLRGGGYSWERELREYRFCGCLLFALNIALTGIVYQMVNDGKGYRYPGFLIYAVAAYAFFSLAMAVINLVRYRKLNSPVQSAVKAIGLATALVALLSLQSAMFASFGGDGDFQRLMNRAAGIVICLLLFGMAAVMVTQANRELKAIKRNAEQNAIRRNFYHEQQ